MDTRSSATKRLVIASATIYGVAWFFSLALYWAGLGTGTLGGGMIMGYTLLVFYAVLPLAGLVSAALVGRARELGLRRLFAPIALAALYSLFSMATFGLSTAVGATNIATAAGTALVFGLVPAAVGLAAGWIYERVRGHRCN